MISKDSVVSVASQQRVVPRNRAGQHGRDACGQIHLEPRITHDVIYADLTINRVIPRRTRQVIGCLTTGDRIVTFIAIDHDTECCGRCIDRIVTRCAGVGIVTIKDKRRGRTAAPRHRQQIGPTTTVNGTNCRVTVALY